MSNKKKKKKKLHNSISKKQKKKKVTKKKSPSKKSGLKKSQTKKKTNTKKKTSKNKEATQIQTKPSKTITITQVLLILVIIGIVICSIISIYKVYQAEYNRIVKYEVHTNLDYYEICFEDKKGNKTNWQKLENAPIETYARNNIINIKNSKDNAIETISCNDKYFKYLGDDYYLLPSDDTYTIDYVYFGGTNNENISFISNNDNVTIKDNIITCNKSGESIIYAIYENEKIELLTIKSSTLIVKRPIEFDDTREFLSCEQYTKEENDELDQILKEKIDDAGFKTRAGAIEALRFIALDLPYRVPYFYENGRYPYVDGEGRYYHIGLYLSADRYNYLIDPNKKNKGTWGCKLYSIPYDGIVKNGLDCSGLICWALYNAGYDPDDIRGADLLMNLGENVSPSNAIKNKTIKVGDLVHNNEADSHIGMIVGIDDENNYYVAQAIWYKPNGVCITKFSENKMKSHWNEVILMDEYYQNDGNLANMWY